MSTQTASAHHPFRSEEAKQRYLTHYDSIAKEWPLDSEERTVTTNYGQTFIRVSGPHDAPPLVLLPGGSSNSLGWRPIISAMSEGYRTYALDAIYDFGRSVSARPIASTSDVMAWLDGVCNALELDGDVNIMGLSFGAWTTAEYVLHAPQRLRKAVWLSPAGVVGPISRGFMLHAMSCIIPTRAGVGHFVRWVMPDLAARQDYFDSLVDEMVVAMKSYPPKKWPEGSIREFSDEELAGIGVPVLFLVGDRDKCCPDAREGVSRVNAVAPKIETELIPGAGHEAIVLQSHLISERVLRFLDA